MRRLLVPAAACLVTVAACGGSAEPPAWVAQRPELPSCGEDHPSPDGFPDLPARQCFREAFEADRPAELTRLTYGDEGEYGRLHFRVLGGGQYEIVEQHVDSPLDGGDTTGWTRSECDRFVFVDDANPEIDGAPMANWAGECRQVEHVSA